MSTTYLDFEEPLRELEEQIQQTRELGEQTQVDMQDKISELENVLAAKTKEVFANLTPWQRVQLSRHPDRPYTLAYINALTNGQFQELHGDRNVKDDCRARDSVWLWHRASEGNQGWFNNHRHHNAASKRHRRSSNRISISRAVCDRCQRN